MDGHLNVPGHRDLGRRLRARRSTVGISLRELARRIDVSASLLSQIETGRVQPSVATLYAIVSELGGSIDELLSGADAAAGTVPDADAAVAASADGSADAAVAAVPAPRVQGAEDRRALELRTGVHWERLTSTSEPGVEFLYVVYEPGSGSSAPDRYQQHDGTEWGYVISGTLHVCIDDEEHVLGPGDSIAFESAQPHRLHNPGTDPVHGVWFVLGREGSRPAFGT